MSAQGSQSLPYETFLTSSSSRKTGVRWTFDTLQSSVSFVAAEVFTSVIICWLFSRSVWCNSQLWKYSIQTESTNFGHINWLHGIRLWNCDASSLLDCRLDSKHSGVSHPGNFRSTCFAAKLLVRSFHVRCGAVLLFFSIITVVDACCCSHGAQRGQRGAKVEWDYAGL